MTMSRPPITRLRPYTPSRGLVAGQTFTSERQYRNALARAKGFASHYQRTQHPHLITSAKELEGLHPAAITARRLAFKVLAEARRTGEHIAKVIRDYRVSLASVKRYVGPALEKRGGRFFAKESDRLYRRLTTITSEGVVKLDTHSSKTASMIGKYNNAVRQFLRTGNADALREWRGKTFQVKRKRYRFETDPEKIRGLYESGELNIEEIYRWGGS